jgi:acyl-CoA synthetase (AMP-forming)/AMP-acid ligase II
VRILKQTPDRAPSTATSTRWARSASTIPACWRARPIPRAPRTRISTISAYLRTGDLGRIDADGYIWITGRAKDLIIRGGHNIDPAEIEEALAGHTAVAFAGAIGQPDAFAGELPCVYVELVGGAHARSRRS